MPTMGFNDKTRFTPLERTSSGRVKFRRRIPQKTTYLFATLCLILLFYITHNVSTTGKGSRTAGQSTRLGKPQATQTPSRPEKSELSCHSLPGADDVLVILKTGSTELADKLPIHLNTTLRCYPHYLIFSDYEEVYHGEHIYDALAHVSPDIQEEHEDFELWRRLQDKGRKALKPSELSGPISRPQGAEGKPKNPGWKLDKWKFLPMMNETLNMYPDKKWYVFVETDTYVLWQTLLNYLAVLDERKPYYIGGQIWIGDILFAHGGTGFAVSRPAMQNVVSMFQKHQEDWEDFTDDHWAGDCILGKAFKDSGTNLTEAWPIWQGEDIGKMEYARTEDGGKTRVWCSPTVAYHHLAPKVVGELWGFEQGWMGRNQDPKSFLRHRDMFTQFVLPRITQSKTDWYNHAGEDRGPVENLEACRAICEKDADCLQYALSTDYRCLSTTTPNLGEFSRGVESGWMVDRLRKWGDKMEKCSKKEGQWIT